MTVVLLAFPLRLLMLVTLGGLMACAEEVVLGQFLERGDAGANADGGFNTDGGSVGSSAGGASGGGSVGGGSVGGGSVGGGSVGGGSVGGGSVGGGSVGGGSVGGGSVGGGSVGGGSVGGGSVGGGSVGGGSVGGGGAGGMSGGGLADAGPELSVSIMGPRIVVADAGVQAWLLTVTNSGAIDVMRPAVRLQVRPAANFTGCEDAGISLFDGGMEVTCRATDAAAGGVGTASFSLELGTTLRFTDLTADVLPVAGELNSSNNSAAHAVAVAQVGLVPVSIFPPEPRLADVSICVGTLITSYAQCVPGSRLGFQFLLQADGGWGEADAGGVEAEWVSANQGRNITFINPASPGATGYIGASVSALCFEGVLQNGAGRVYAGAFRACLQ